MRKAKEMNYKGSLLDLFKEAEAGGFANDINKPKKSTYVNARSGYGFPTTYQDGGTNDPEMIFRDKYNTKLTKDETVEFMKWVESEKDRQGRDIMMDMGAYDIQGFWKSGDYLKMDKDNHGSDRWKKPNHPTFSNQSIYHNVDGFQGGTWQDDGGYIPSEHTKKLYDAEYYNWLFGREPHRPEYLVLPEVQKGKKRDGGYKKEGKIIPNDVFASTQTITPRHGLDSMPNSLQSFLSKKHQLSRSDMEIDDTIKMIDGGLASTSTDDEGKLLKNIMMEQVASTGRNIANVNMAMNAIGQHESENDILSIQVSGDKEKGFFDGPGRGKYQYETDQGSNSGNTAVNRLYNFLIDVKKETKESIESKYPIFFNQYKKKSANFAEFGEDMQDALFIADNIYGGKDRANAFNTMATKKDLSSMDIFRFWLKNHKKKVNGVLANELDKSTIDEEFEKWSDRTKSIFEASESEVVD
jgi:hypothetical protein